MMNALSVIGRLESTPTLSKTATGKPKTNFILACQRLYPGTNTPWQTDFLDIVAHNTLAEFVCKHFSQGQLLLLNGSVQTLLFEDINGMTQKRYQIVAETVTNVTA